VTEDFTDDFNPVFDPEGGYLYFLSDRDFNAELGHFEPSFTYNKMTRIYVVTLQADSLSPFAPQSDETESMEENWKRQEKEKKEREEIKGKIVEHVGIDISGIENRIVAVPIDPGNYFGLKTAKSKIFYLSSPNGTLTGEKPGPRGELHLYDLKERKDQVLLSPVDGYDLSCDGEKLIYKSGDQYGILDARYGSGKVGDSTLKLDQMQMKLNRREAGTRFLLRSQPARSGLGSDTHKIWGASALCRPSFRFELHHRRDDRRALLLAYLRQRRRQT
jgi:tricorn protease